MHSYYRYVLAKSTLTSRLLNNNPAVKCEINPFRFEIGHFNNDKAGRWTVIRDVSSLFYLPPTTEFVGSLCSCSVQRGKLNSVLKEQGWKYLVMLIIL